jgi:hypothetical protein
LRAIERSCVKPILNLNPQVIDYDGQIRADVPVIVDGFHAVDDRAVVAIHNATDQAA